MSLAKKLSSKVLYLYLEPTEILSFSLFMNVLHEEKVGFRCLSNG